MRVELYFSLTVLFLFSCIAVESPPPVESASGNPHGEGPHEPAWEMSQRPSNKSISDTKTSPIISLRSQQGVRCLKSKKHDAMSKSKTKHHSYKYKSKMSYKKGKKQSKSKKYSSKDRDYVYSKGYSEYYYDGYYKGRGKGNMGIGGYDGHFKGKGKGNIGIGVQLFLLVDAGKNTPLTVINDGDEINVQDLFDTYGVRRLAFECVTFGNVKSTHLESNFGARIIDNQLPWTLFGDINGNYIGLTLDESLGLWRITCQPFSSMNVSGAAGATAEVRFVLSDGKASSQPPIPPTIPPEREPTGSPVVSPTFGPTSASVPTMPTVPSSAIPTPFPTLGPTSAPTERPALEIVPTTLPTISVPTTKPTESPLLDIRPTVSPTTARPSKVPTPFPVEQPPQGIVYGLQPDCNVFDDSRFNICLDISSESGEVEEWFQLLVEAKERWERVITEER
eukprot:scaffold1953_cov176-Amphora_coffeaeformis.AAC.21